MGKVKSAMFWKVKLFWSFHEVTIGQEKLSRIFNDDVLQNAKARKGAWNLAEDKNLARLFQQSLLWPQQFDCRVVGNFTIT